MRNVCRALPVQSPKLEGRLLSHVQRSWGCAASRCRPFSITKSQASVPPSPSVPVPTVGELLASRPSLAEEFPDLAREWHPSLNGTLTPNDVTVFSRHVVWWKCSNDQSHVWAEPVRARLGRTWRNKLLKQLDLKRTDMGEKSSDNRFPGQYARECAEYDTAALPAPLAELVADIIKGDKHACYTRGWGIHVASDNAGLGPIAKQWQSDPTAFGVAWMELRNFRQDRSPTPLERCQSKGWSTQLLRQIYKPQPCPCCSAKRSVFAYKHSLEAARPDLAAAMHPTLNGTLKPRDIAQWSSIDVWWQCVTSPDHVWRGPVYELARRGNRDEHSHTHGIPCGYCQRRYPDMRNNVAENAKPILYRYSRVRNGRPPEFATCFQSSLPRHWWDLLDLNAAILLPTPFAMELETQDLWSTLEGLIRRSSNEVLHRLLCTEREWLQDGGIGPADVELAAEPATTSKPEIDTTDINSVTAQHLLACLPSLPYYSPIAVNFGKRAEDLSVAELFLQRDMSGSMHQVGDRIRISLRLLVKFLGALKDWHEAVNSQSTAKRKENAILKTSATFSRVYSSMLEHAPSLRPTKHSVEAFRNFRRVSAQNARKRRDMTSTLPVQDGVVSDR